MVDLVIKEKYLTKKAKKGLANLRQSGANITDLINKILEQYYCMKKTA